MSKEVTKIRDGVYECVPGVLRIKHNELTGNWDFVEREWEDRSWTFVIASFNTLGAALIAWETGRVTA